MTGSTGNYPPPQVPARKPPHTAAVRPLSFSTAWKRRGGEALGGTNLRAGQMQPPPPPCANTGQVLVQGAKVRKHGVAVFGKARVTAWHVSTLLLKT